MHPLDLDARCLRRPAATLERHRRDVERRHAPAALREPHGIGALPAAHIQRAAGIEVLDLGDERAVGATAPDPVGAGIALVPLAVVVHGHSVRQLRGAARTGAWSK